MARPMGLGILNTDNIIFKRKNRWTMNFTTCNGSTISEYAVKLASRPNITIEETEINFLHGRMWIPGKGTWETITVTFYDYGGAGDSGVSALYGWLASVYDYTDPINLYQSSTKKGYSGTANLKLYDGCGKELEQWTLGHAWPQAINFGELDYASSDEVNIEVTLRYADVKYVNLCGPAVQRCPCTGC